MNVVCQWTKDDGVVYHSVIDAGGETAATQCGRTVKLSRVEPLNNVPADVNDEQICSECQRRSYNDPTIRVSPEGESV